jgi:hypothetical protein
MRSQWLRTKSPAERRVFFALRFSHTQGIRAAGIQRRRQAKPPALSMVAASRQGAQWFGMGGKQQLLDASMRDFGQKHPPY